MQVPILKQGPFLIASIQAVLTDHDLNQFRDEIANKIEKCRSKGVIIDVASLDVIDSFAARILGGIASTTRLRGAETVVVGIHPDVALAMVQMGLTFSGVETALDLEEGLSYLSERLKG
jgi:rsbT antagonist protein RsbS